MSNCEHRATKEVCCDCGEDLEYDGPAQLRRELARLVKDNARLHAFAVLAEKFLTQWEHHDVGHHTTISRLQARINELEETSTTFSF